MTTRLLAPFTALALAPLLLFQDPPQPPPTPSPPPAPAPAPARTPQDLRQLQWLCGTWTLRDGDRTTEEHWRPLQGSTLLGSSHTFGDDRTHFFEFLRIALTRGQIAYLAMPAGRPATTFLLTKLEDGVVEFENGRHDHPQRIRYERTAAGVTATISQLDGSRAQQFVFVRKAD